MTPQLIKKWLRSSQDRLGLDILLGQAPQASAPLRERLNWIGRLVNWVRTLGPNASEMGLQSGRIQLVRLRYTLQILERNPELKKKVAETLRSVIRDTRALELFMNVGIPNQEGFFGEVGERINLRFLPQPPRDHDLVSVFSEALRFESDSEWIRQMDPTLFQGWLDLFHYAESAVEPGWNTLVQDARDALHLLTHAVRSVGLSRLIRNRVKEPDFRKFPFYELTARADALLLTLDSDGPVAEASRIRAYMEFDRVLEACFTMVDEVYAYFREQGVSISLVYQMERLKAQMRRSGTLARLLAGYQLDSRFIQEFFVLLVHENIRARRLKGMIRDNLVLVCQKIIETNAETGEHYITRDRAEYWLILRKSMGGGLVTGFTTLIKFLLGHLSLPAFISGLFAFANYSVSFVSLQMLGFTLATKQPAMTASALASKLGKIGDSVSELVDEIVHLIRSQIAAVFGNLSAVVPTVIAIDFLYSLSGSHLTDAGHAQHTMESFSLLGMTPFYAAFTGVLLWLSSIFAGWMGNWFSYRGLPEAIEHHPRLTYVFGLHRSQRMAAFLKRNVAGFSANISLAFLLSMTPQIAAFFGLPLDVRHVTLSSGALTASAMAIGPSVFTQWDFWLAVGGILSMGVLNLAVAFALALTVAVWAKDTSAPKRGVIYRALLKKLWARPWILFVPGADSA